MGWAEYYITGWITACLLAVGLAMARRDAIRTTLDGYGAFLRKPWKLGTFFVAVSTMMIMAPWTGDPTWDWFDAGFMGLLTFLTAPWSIAMIWRVATRREPTWVLYLVVCVWMFSASWSYDLYIYSNTSSYPTTWAANIGASSVLYFSAGIFWNLDWHPGEGVVLAFRRDDWPRVSPHPVFWRIFPFAFPIMALVAISMGYFVLIEFGILSLS